MRRGAVVAAGFVLAAAITAGVVEDARIDVDLWVPVTLVDSGCRGAVRG